MNKNFEEYIKHYPAGNCLDWEYKFYVIRKRTKKDEITGNSWCITVGADSETEAKEALEEFKSIEETEDTIVTKNGLKKYNLIPQFIEYWEW
jgi:hypothetical protein